MAKRKATSPHMLPQDFDLDHIPAGLYKQLRKLAGYYMQRENPSHTLQPTALVHEAFMRLVEVNQLQLNNRTQFFALAAQMMRRILIDHAKAKHAAKRGGGAVKISFDENQHMANSGDPDILALDEALKRLTKLDPRRSKVVELKYFGGLSNEEIAQVVGASPATIKRDWMVARAWLYYELKAKK